jgi:S1-C subfamily serine protease
MALDPRLERLRARADRALGLHTVDQAVAKVRAIIGSHDIPATEPAAQAALTQLRKGDEPTADQLAALELVVRLLRPAVFVRDGQIGDLPDDAAHNLHPTELKDAWSGFRATVTPLLRSIGRIERTSGKHIGTGFLVAEGILATNRHVLAALTSGTEVLAAKAARVVFKQEDGRTNPPSEVIEIAGVVAIHDVYDVALLALAAPGRPAVPIAATPAIETERVAVIGFPANDPEHNPIFLSALFDGRFGTKRVALGEVLDGSKAPFLFHDCSTTQGNSGSPIFHLASARVVGIHRAGFFMYRNEAVDAAALEAFVAPYR